MIVSLVVAASENGVIGKANVLPWRLPADLRHFRQVTASNPLIMGRKTYESIGRPLPGRRNIIITRKPDLKIPGCEIAHSLTEALDLARQTNPPEACIIGGGEIFREALLIADRIHFTRVHANIEGDTFFQTPSNRDWVETAREDHPADAENPYSYSFITYQRRG